MTDIFDNEIHLGDYVVTVNDFSRYGSSLSWPSKVIGFKHEKYEDDDYILVERRYPIWLRGQPVKQCASDCMITSLHNYINAQKKMLQDDRRRRNEPPPTIVIDLSHHTNPFRPADVEDWQRPYIKWKYIGKDGCEHTNHPQTRKRKARKMRRFVMTKDIQKDIPVEYMELIDKRIEEAKRRIKEEFANK